MEPIVMVPVDLDTFLRKIKDVIVEVVKGSETESQESLLSPSETCQLFAPRISKTTLAKWTKAGTLKSYRIGGRLFYKRSEILEAVKIVKRYDRKLAIA